MKQLFAFLFIFGRTVTTATIAILYEQDPSAYEQYLIYCMN